MGKIVNQTELAKIVGKSDVTIWEWQKEGMPVQKIGERGEANQYDTEAVITWWLAREIKKIAPENQRERLARLQGDKLELDLSVERGVMVPVTEIEPTWHSRVFAAAAYMASRHSRLADILEATPGREAKRQVLKNEDAAFLTKLGVDGERMQGEVDELFGAMAANEASAVLRRIAGDDNQPNTSGGRA